MLAVLVGILIAFAVPVLADTTLVRGEAHNAGDADGTLSYGDVSLVGSDGVDLVQQVGTIDDWEVHFLADMTYINANITGGGQTTADPVSGVGSAGDPITIGADKIDDTHIDWGTGANQVSGSDLPDEDLGDVSITSGAWTVDDVPADTVLWNEIGNPSGNQTFTFSNKTTTFNFTNPNGGWIWNYTGAASGHLLEINQNTGNPSSSTHLLHIEADDKECIPLHIAADMPDNASGTDVIAFKIDTDDNDDPDYVPILVQDDSGGTPDTLFKMDYQGGFVSEGTLTFTDWDIAGSTPTANYLPYVASRSGDIATMGWIDPATLASSTDLDDAYNNSPSANKSITVDDGGINLNAGAATGADILRLFRSNGHTAWQFDDLGQLVGTDASTATVFVLGTVNGEASFNTQQNAVGDFVWASQNHANGMYGDSSANTISVVGTDFYIGDTDTQTDLLLADGSANYVTIDIPAIGTDWAFTLPADDGDAGEFLQTDGSGNGSWEPDNNNMTYCFGSANPAPVTLLSNGVDTLPVAVAGTITRIQVYVNEWNVVGAADTLTCTITYGALGATSTTTATSKAGAQTTFGADKSIAISQGHILQAAMATSDDDDILTFTVVVVIDP
jgi:hypothetical protein